MTEGKFWHLPRAIEDRLKPVLRASRRKPAAILCALAILGLYLLLVSKTGQQSAVGRPSPAPAPSEGVSMRDVGSDSRELAEILGRIAGAGRVEVRLRYAASAANDWVENLRQNHRTVEDRGEDGSIQITTEGSEERTLALARRADGSEAPVEKVSSSPRIAGAVIVADGAGDPAIRVALTRAASAYLGLDLHRIVVLPGRLSE